MTIPLVAVPWLAAGVVLLTPREKRQTQMSDTEDGPVFVFTMEELEALRTRKAELDVIISEASKEAGRLLAKIKAAEFLLDRSAAQGDA